MPKQRKIAFISGASSGIGKAVALKLLEMDIIVIAPTRNADATAKKFPAKFNNSENLFIKKCDLCDDKQREDLFAEINKNFTSLDYLVNSAGMAKRSPVSGDEQCAEQWRDMWGINVDALSQTCRLALPLLHKCSEVASIVNISSLSGVRVPPSGGFYASTKFAVGAFSEALRLELRAQNAKVRVGVICPGYVDTPMLEDYFAHDLSELDKLRASGQMLSAEEVARSVLHMLLAPPGVEVAELRLRASCQIV